MNYSMYIKKTEKNSAPTPNTEPERGCATITVSFQSQIPRACPHACYLGTVLVVAVPVVVPVPIPGPGPSPHT